MGVMTTVLCRTVQTVRRAGGRLRPARKQVLETGAGAIYALGQLLRDRQLRAPLMVVGADSAAAGFRLRQALEQNDVPLRVLDDLPARPTAAEGERIAAAFRDEGRDCLIAVGDGAVLDLVKAAAARTQSKGRTILDMAGAGRVPRRRVPAVIAVPTAAGSGAESMAGATVTDGRGTVFFLEGEALMPAVAVSDPDLLADTPREKVADGGMNGLCRCVEAFLAASPKDSAAMTRAAQGTELFFASLEPCWNTGGTPRDRADLLAASRIAGRVASGTGAGGYARAMIRAAQTVCGMAFAPACAAILPAVLEKYGISAHERLASLAVMADLEEDGDRSARAAALIARLRAAAFRMGLPDTLEGVTAAQAAEIADMAAAIANPRMVSPAVWTRRECRQLLDRLCPGEPGEGA